MWLVRVSLIVTLLGPFQYGISLVILNSMLKPLANDLGFDKQVGGGVAVAAMYLGAAIGGLLAGPFEDVSGKYTQMWMGVLYAVGNLLCAFATDHKVCWGGSFDGCVAGMVLAGRLIVGLASGLVLVVSPRFLAEISPPDIRGALISMCQLMSGIGFFIGLIIGLPYEFDSFDCGYEWWRVMFLLITIPSISQATLACLTFPLHKQTRGELRHSLRAGESTQGRADDTNEQEAQQPECIVPHDTGRQSDAVTASLIPSTQGKDTSIAQQWMQTFKLVTQKCYRRAWILGIGMPVLGRLIGVDVFSAYTTTIFEEAGFEHAVLGSILFGVADVISSMVPVYFLDKLGRLRTADVSFIGVSICHFGLASSGFVRNSVAGPIAVVSAFFFMLLYGGGAGTLYKTYAAEVVPPEVARIILGTGQCVSTLSALGTVLVFPTLLDTMGVTLYFFLHGSFVIASLLFLRAFMIETKGRELEEIVAEMTGSSTDMLS